MSRDGTAVDPGGPFGNHLHGRRQRIEKPHAPRRPSLSPRSSLHIPSAGRVIAIGDIHGCSVALATLLETIRPGPADTLVVLGDVIDYGPDSRGVLERLKAARQRTQLILLIGNHEELLFAVLDQGRDLDSWTRHGGDQTLASYGVDRPRDLPAEDIAFLRAARPHHETDTHAFVHAGYYPNQPLTATPSSALFWEPLEPGRAWPHYSGKTFVVGHTPQTSGEVLDLGFVVCIDTDCSRGNWLTALDTTTGRIWQSNQGGDLRSAINENLHRRSA